MKIITVFAIASSLVLSLGACAHEALQQQDHIAVVGMGEVEAEPDQAVLRVSVSAQQADLPAAKKLADSRYLKVLAVIKKAGIDDRQVKSTQLLAQPQYEWESRKRIYKGERVSRSLSITLIDLEKVSPLMQALVANEVSTIDGLDAGFQDRAGLLQQALGAAADDAQRKAKFLAERLGRDLGSAYLITEYNDQAPTMVRGAEISRSSMKSADAPPPEMFGTQRISARVNVSFNLL